MYVMYFIKKNTSVRSHQIILNSFAAINEGDDLLSRQDILLFLLPDIQSGKFMKAEDKELGGCIGLRINRYIGESIFVSSASVNLLLRVSTC